MRVVAAEHPDRAHAVALGAHFGGAVHDVEKFEIVARHHEDPRKIQYGRVQPSMCVDVEVVGRLVQQEHLGFGEKFGSQCQQHRFPTGQRTESAVEIGSRGDDAAESELVEHGHGAVLGIPSGPHCRKVGFGSISGLDALQCFSKFAKAEDLVYSPAWCRCHVLR